MKKINEEVTDPLGNRVHFSQCRCNCQHLLQDEKAFDQIEDVIQKPALIIQSNEVQKQLYYFRLVGEDLSLLLSVKVENDEWVVATCQKNPTKEYLHSLMATGKIIR